MSLYFGIATANTNLNVRRGNPGAGVMASLLFGNQPVQVTVPRKTEAMAKAATLRLASCSCASFGFSDRLHLLDLLVLSLNSYFSRISLSSTHTWSRVSISPVIRLYTWSGKLCLWIPQKETKTNTNTGRCKLQSPRFLGWLNG